MYVNLTISLRKIVDDNKVMECTAFAAAVKELQELYRGIYGDEVWVWFQLRNPLYNEILKSKWWDIEIVCMAPPSLKLNKIDFHTDVSWAFKNIFIKELAKAG